VILGSTSARNLKRPGGGAKAGGGGAGLRSGRSTIFTRVRHTA